MRLRFSNEGSGRPHNLSGRPMPAGAVEMLDRLIEELGIEGHPWLYMSMFGATEMGSETEPWCLSTPLERLDEETYGSHYAKWQHDRWHLVHISKDDRTILHRGPRYEP